MFSVYWLSLFPRTIPPVNGYFIWYIWRILRCGDCKVTYILSSHIIAPIYTSVDSGAFSAELPDVEPIATSDHLTTPEYFPSKQNSRFTFCLNQNRSQIAALAGKEKDEKGQKGPRPPSKCRPPDSIPGEIKGMRCVNRSVSCLRFCFLPHSQGQQRGAD